MGILMGILTGILTGILCPIPPQGHDDAINCIAYSNDGKHVASGSWDKTVKVWSMVTDRNKWYCTATLKVRTVR
eukprot:1018709-Prorocentrum_minimum.AAC.1